MDLVKSRFQWIEYKGRKILLNDFKGLEGDDYVKAIKESEKESLSYGFKTVYMINDVTDSYMTPESTKAAKHWVNTFKEKELNLIIALVGIEGLRRVIAQAIRRDMYFAKNIEDAKEWLSKQE